MSTKTMWRIKSQVVQPKLITQPTLIELTTRLPSDLEQLVGQWLSDEDLFEYLPYLPGLTHNKTFWQRRLPESKRMNQSIDRLPVALYLDQLIDENKSCSLEREVGGYRMGLYVGQTGDFNLMDRLIYSDRSHPNKRIFFQRVLGLIEGLVSIDQLEPALRALPHLIGFFTQQANPSEVSQVVQLIWTSAASSGSSIDDDLYWKILARSDEPILDNYRQSLPDLNQLVGLSEGYWARTRTGSKQAYRLGQMIAGRIKSRTKIGSDWTHWYQFLPLIVHDRVDLISISHLDGPSLELLFQFALDNGRSQTLIELYQKVKPQPTFSFYRLVKQAIERWPELSDQLKI